MTSEPYIPNACDAVVAYFGRNAAGNLRCHCVRCNDAAPLSDAHKVYGDLDQTEPITHGRGPVVALVEYGIPAAVRCRIY